MPMPGASLSSGIRTRKRSPRRRSQPRVAHSGPLLDRASVGGVHGHPAKESDAVSSLFNEKLMQTLQIRSADRSEGHRAISAKHPRYIAVKIVDFGPDLMKCHSPADGQERLCRESELRRSMCCKSFCGAGEQIEARKGRHFIETTAARGLELAIFYSREGT